MATDAGPVIRSLLGLCRERTTGVVEVTAEGIKTSIYLMEGSTVFVEEEPSLETLGRLLVRNGVLTSEQYTAVLQNMVDALATDEELRFGESAIALGLLSADALNDALVDQARWRLARAFQRSNPEWHLDDHRERVDGVPLYDLRIEPIVLLALRSSPDEYLRDDALPPALAAVADYFPVLNDEAAVIARTFGLGPAESTYVTLLDGSKSIAECLHIGPAVADRVAVLGALLHTRAIKLVAPPKPGIALQGRLHVDGAADAPAAAPRPPPPPPTPAANARTQLSPVVATALKKAAGVKRTAQPDSAHVARLNGEIALQRGRDLLSAGRADEALADFRQAYKLDPSPEIELHLKWTEIVAREGRMTDAQRVALQNLSAAVSRQPSDSGFGAYVMGKLAALEGRKRDSKQWLTRAFRLDPKLREWTDMSSEDGDDPPPSSKRGVLEWIKPRR